MPSIKGYFPVEDLEYARADDDARELFPNKRFKFRRLESGYSDDGSTDKPNSRRNRRRVKNANKRLKANQHKH